MKAGPYVLIDAHILTCRLHHSTGNKYSVALKTNKDQPIATPFKTAQDFLINMDTHLSLHADKHSYDSFPMISLIVSAILPNGDVKSFGSVFVNYKKEGVQVCQVSECSCKDKAFQVELSFTTKLVQAKNSKTKTAKNQLVSEVKPKYSSQRVTPRNSRYGKDVKVQKQIQRLAKVTPVKKQLNHVKSQQLLFTIKKQIDNQQECSNGKKSHRQMNEFQAKIAQVQLALAQCRRMLEQQKMENSFLSEMLDLQVQKSSQALSYISFLQDLIRKDAGFKSTQQIIQVKPVFKTSFKVIEEKDEIIQMNQELHSQLQEQKQQNAQMALQIESLKHQIARLEAQLTKQKNNNEFSSSLRLKSQLEVNKQNNIMVASRCKTQQEKMQLKQDQAQEESQQNIITLQNMKKQLIKQISQLQAQKQALKQQIDKLKPIKKVTSPSKPPLKKQQPRRQNGKQKPSKPPLKTPKKGSQIQTYNTSSFKTEATLGTPKLPPKKTSSVAIQNTIQMITQ